MSVGAAEPEEPEDQDEYLADDDTPVEPLAVEIKRKGKPLNRLESEKLSAEMWEEYASGMGQREIADLHGMSRTAVTRRLRLYRKKLGVEDIEEAKSLDLGRYEALIERVWKVTFENPEPEKVRILALLMDQRAKLLGLNAPKKLQVGGELLVTPSPALLTHLDRLAESREALQGETKRPELEAPENEVVDAELIDDGD